MSSLAIWADDENILIGDEDCKEGDPLIVIAITQDNVIAWIRALTIILEEGEVQTLPGEIGKCSNVV
jgi:hypothetical protein